MDERLQKWADARKTEYLRKRRWYILAAVLCLVAALWTAYALSTPAITMEQTVYCGLQEHTVHGASCFDADGTLVCKTELHTHSLSCYADPDTDLETPEIWERTVSCAELTGEVRHDLVAVAMTQLGYAESGRNFTVGEDGSIRGYTRFGAWYGTPYAKWDALLCAFCMEYAGLTEPAFADSRAWLDSLAERGLLRGRDYVPQPGDLVFLDCDGETCMGIVSEDGMIYSSGGAVSLESLPTDGSILGFGLLLPEKTQAELIREADASVQAASGTSISNASGFANLKNGGTYYLSADITVSSTVTIANGKTTTLDLNGHNIYVKTNTLFNVSGGTLTIKNDVNDTTITRQSASGTVYGRTASYAGGKLTYYVTETEVIEPSTGATRETQVGYTVGKGLIAAGSTGIRAFDVTGGTLNLNGGYICNFSGVDVGAAVYVHNGQNAAVNLNGAVIAGNSANKGGGIYMDGRSRLNIHSGAIAGNTASGDGGGGIYAACWSDYADISMDGGYITNNYSSNSDYWAGGGGVRLERQSRLFLNGGYITSNKANGGGGGVRTHQDWGNNYSGRIEMTGGFITANNCLNAEGGGLNINAGGSMTMSAGYITNNVAGGGAEDGSFQHWGGGGMFCSENSSSVVIQNSLVTENKAGGFGGGVAGCSTGRIITSPNAGTGIFENDALGLHTSGGESTKNEDHYYAAENEVFMSHGYQDYFCALSSSVTGAMLGGGAAMWEGSSDGVPVSTTNTTDTIIGGSVTGLTSHSSEGDRALARAAATSFFNGNESPTHGGGILANGYLILGNVDSVEVYARLELQGLRKKLMSDDGLSLMQQPDAYSFVVVSDRGEEVARGTNSADGEIRLDRRLVFTSAGTFHYYIYELHPEDESGMLYDTARYKLTVKVTADTGVGTVPWTDIDRVQYKFTSITVTELNSGETVYTNSSPDNNEAKAVGIKPLGGNVFTNVIANTPGEDTPTQDKPAMSVSVKKTWASGTAGASSVSVSLLKDGTAVDTQTLSSQNGWSYTWNNLDFGAEYTVEEAPVTNYTAEYSYSYSYTTTPHVDTSMTNGALLYVLSGSKFVPATSLSTGKEYAIASPDGTKLLCVVSGREDTALNSGDTLPVTRQADNSYLASDVPDTCRFVYELLQNRDGYNFYYLKVKALTSYLLVQWTDDGCLKTTNNNWYSSPMRVTNGQLMGQYEWSSSNEWRYIIWDGAKFNSDTQISYNTYESIDSAKKSYTVTNTKTSDIRYSLSVRKCEQGNTGRVIAGAVFELRNGSSPLRFTDDGNGFYTYSAQGRITSLTTNTGGYIRIGGLPAGTYQLVETRPPPGYIAAGAQTVVLSPDTPDHSLSLQVEDKKLEYLLPETGGIGTGGIYLAGAALVLLSLTALRKKRKTT